MFYRRNWVLDGYVDRPFIFVSIINHPDGNSRSYYEAVLTDTASAVKLDGKWRMMNNIFYGTYTGALFTSHDSIVIQGPIETPFTRIDGFLTPFTSPGYLRVVPIKHE